MIEFVSLNTIITDLLNMMRSSKVSKTEPISKRHLEGLVHQYRAVVLKQDLDKNKMPNPDYIQEINNIPLVAEDQAGSDPLYSNRYVYRTSFKLPKTIDLNFKPGVTYVGTIDGQEIQLAPQGRAKWQIFRKYVADMPLAYIKNEYVYVTCANQLGYITVRGVFEVPTEVIDLVNSNTTRRVPSINEPYPVPITMVPVIKEMIFKRELNIMISEPSDDKNDASNKVEPNQVKDV